MEKLDGFLARHFAAVFWGLTGVCLILYSVLLCGDYMWIDRSYSMAMIKHPFSEIWSITAKDVHPPLYYWYVKVISQPFGYNLTVAKAASILPYMFIIVFGGLQIKKYFNERTAILFMGLFFCFPYILSYSVEVRMYALAAAFVFACGTFAYKLWADGGGLGNVIGIVISGVGAAYTHYFAFVSVCVIYVLLFVALVATPDKRRLLLFWLCAAAVSVVLYIPWLAEFVQQLTRVSDDYWIATITGSTLVSYVKKYFGASGFKTFVLFFFLAYLLCLIWLLVKKDKKHVGLAICCIVVPLGTIVIGVVVSIVVRPVFLIRYSIPSIPILVAFMAIVLGQAKNEMLFGAILSLAIVGGASNYGGVLYKTLTEHNYLPLEQYEQVDAYVVYGQINIAYTLAYYVTEQPIYYSVVPAENPYYNRKPVADFETDNVESAILIVTAGDTSPVDQYYENYNVEYLGLWESGNDVDAYLLTRK